MTKILTAPPVELNERLILALAHARAQGRSAYRVAAEAEVHPSELSRWVNGRRSPTAQQAARIAKALGVPVDELFGSER